MTSRHEIETLAALTSDRCFVPDLIDTALAHLDHTDRTAVLIRARAISRDRNEGRILADDYIALADAVHCPDDVSPLTWLRDLGLIEQDGAGKWRSTLAGAEVLRDLVQKQSS
jgi:hypothetical protein